MEGAIPYPKPRGPLADTQPYEKEGGGVLRGGTNAYSRNVIRSPRRALFRPGERIGAYVVEEELGRGAMSVVYRARHVEIGRRVAVKVLSPTRGSTRAMDRRFRREAQILSQISHDNVLAALDFGRAGNGVPYLITEYLRGQTLQATLEREGPLQWQQALVVTRQLLRALRSTHAKRIVHRDVKPGNCMLVVEDGQTRLKLIDFGVAKSYGQPGPEITHVSTAVGTPCYMSPEQVRGEGVDARSDLYAVGAVLFELLVGRAPFVARSSAEVIARHLRDEVPDVFAENPECDAPPAVSQFIRRAMAKEPWKRFLDADSMLIALDELAAGGRVESEVSGSTAAPDDDTFDDRATLVARRVPACAGRSREGGEVANVSGKTLAWLGVAVLVASGLTTVWPELVRASPRLSDLIGTDEPTNAGPPQAAPHAAPQTTPQNTPPRTADGELAATTGDEPDTPRPPPLQTSFVSEPRRR